MDFQAAMMLTYSLSDRELQMLQTRCYEQRKALSRRATRTFTRGDVVRWHSTCRGVTLEGTITKVGTKNLIVQETGNLMNWRVPAGMCERV